MPRRKSILTQAEITRIINGAGAAGITMGIVATKDAVVFMPVDSIDLAPTLSVFDKWKRERHAKDKAGNAGNS